MPSNRMSVHIERVDLEVKPIKREGLYEAKYRLSEESVETEGYGTLIQQSDNRIAKDKCHKRIGSLNLVLDILARYKIESGLGPALVPFTHPTRTTHQTNHEHWPENVHHNGDPDESLSVWFVDVDTRDPDQPWYKRRQ